MKVAQSKNGTSVYDYDEIAAIFKVRYMSALEAYLRLIGYPVVHSSHTVLEMPVYLPGEERCIFEEGQEENAERGLGQENKLTGYFELCSRNDEDGELARKTRYDQIELYFTWQESAKRYKKREKSAGKLLTRVWTVHPRNSELYAERLLLLNRLGSTSFDDLKTITKDDGTKQVCGTFNEAAKLLGLLDSDTFWKSVMEDAANEIMNSNRLIRHFAQLVFYHPPNDPKGMFDLFLDKMFPQPKDAKDPDISKQIRKCRVLNKIEYYLRKLGSDCKLVLKIYKSMFLVKICLVGELDYMNQVIMTRKLWKKKWKKMKWKMSLAVIMKEKRKLTGNLSPKNELRKCKITNLN